MPGRELGTRRGVELTVVGDMIQVSVRYGLSHYGVHWLSSVFPYSDIELLCVS